MGKHYKFSKWLFSFFLIAISTSIIFFLHSCKNVLDKTDEGSIEYEITYADSMKNDIMYSILPSKMFLKFKPDFTLNELKMGMGIITASFIANAENKTLTSLFKVVDKKYALKFTPLQTTKELNKLPKFSIKYVSETKQIAGYKCKKAIATEIGNEVNSFPIFYTTDIHLKNPNWNSPYPEITGVLMEYQLVHNDIAMQVTAKKVELEDLDDAIFTASEEYKVVQKEELPEIIQDFF